MASREDRVLRLKRLFCKLGLHGQRDQDPVGYCPHCGHFLHWYSNGRMWTRYIGKWPPDHDPRNCGC